MLLNFISVTNKLSKWESEGVNYYSKQLPNYVSLNFEDIKSQQHPKRSVDEVVLLESKSILSKFKDSEFTISFDIKGEPVSSENFSQIIKSCIENNKKANFIIGGSFGLSDEILNSSNKVISISKMTFPHRLFKIILMEQIYRAFSILNNSPYHK
jgi:23S rRNA (pseudouridine1915-N3)-methyltransferase